MLPNLARGDKSGGINLVPRSLVDEAEGEANIVEGNNNRESLKSLKTSKQTRNCSFAYT